MRQRNSLFLFYPILFFLSTSCSDLSSGSDDKKSGQDPVIPQDKATELFKEGVVPQFNITVGDSAWEWLQENATLEEYVPAQLQADGVDIGTVGVRYKGSYGNLFNCFENGERLSNCPRLSLKLKFDKYDSTLRYNGLKRLNLHSLRGDQSLLRDKLSYRLYREMGVHAPRCGHAMVSINGKPSGLYGMVEQIDGRFTDSRWEPGDGNLYKEAWPASTSAESYVRTLKTNEEMAATQGMALFAEELPTILATGDKTLFASYTDPVQALNYLAVDLAIDNIDGYRTFYCGPNPKSVKDCGPHNFFWYEKEEGAYFTLIPWDLDATFPQYNWLPAMPEWNDLTYSCDQPRRSSNNVVWAPVCDPYFRILATHYKEEYLDTIERLLNGAFAPGIVESWLDKWSNNIEHYVGLDSLYSPASWRQGVETLKNLVAVARWQMEQRLQGHSPEPVKLRADTINTFETINSALATAFANAYCNNSSTIYTSIETESPLSGSTSLLLNWIYRNEGDQAWGQWGSWSAFWQGGGDRDLRQLEKIKLKIASSSDRYFNIDLLSSRNSKPSLSKNWGWYFYVTTEPKVIELPYDSLQMLYAWRGQDPAADDQPPLDTLFRYSTGLAFYPEQIGRLHDGFYPEGVVDSGAVKIDDIEFIYK